MFYCKYSVLMVLKISYTPPGLYIVLPDNRITSPAQESVAWLHELQTIYTLVLCIYFLVILILAFTLFEYVDHLICKISANLTIL